MASPSPINYTKTKRIVLLIDLNPLLLQSPNTNLNYINNIITSSNILLSFHSLSSSLFSFKLFFSSLSPLRSFTALHRILPDLNSASISFHSPPQTLHLISNTLRSIPDTSMLTDCFTVSNCESLVSNVVQLCHEYDWGIDFDDVAVNEGEFVDIRSNMIVLLSPVCRMFNEFHLNDDCINSLDRYRKNFRDVFSVVNHVFSAKDIHFCWIDIRDNKEELKVNECEEERDVVRDEIRKFGWGYCSSDAIVLGSAFVSFGLIYPSIMVSGNMLDSCRLDDEKGIRGQLSFEITDVSGKPLECKCCDLELMCLKGLGRRGVNDVFRTWEVGRSEGAFLGGLDDGVVTLRVTGVRRYNKCNVFDELSSECFLVRSVGSGKKEKDGLDDLFADRVLELLARENCEFFDKCTLPTWQIFLSFLYREGYWAMLSLSNSNGDSCMGILKPFTIHSAVLVLVEKNHLSVLNSGGANLLINKNVSKSDTVSLESNSLLGKYVCVGDLKRRKMKKHAHRDLTWSSFCKAAYEFWDVDLAAVYFASGFKKAKKLKFLKCWMTQAKTDSLSHKNVPHGSCQTSQGSNQPKETDVNENLAANCEENNEPLSRMETAAALLSCSETLETFFGTLPIKIQHGLESDGADLKILAERLVNQSIYWLRQKHKTVENLDESCTMQVAEIIKLLLREPKDMKEHKDNNTGSTSECVVRKYELQIFLRLEILQSEYAGSIKGSMKVKLVKQICSLLEIIQFLVEGGIHGDLTLYAYVERTIKLRYSQNLGDVIDKIYDKLDLLPFGDEDEAQALMFNSEDSNQSWREKSDRNDTLASKMIQDSLSLDDESSHPLKNVDMSHGNVNDAHAQKLNEARERRERARRFVSFTSRMPDLQRVWAPKQSKATKVKPESKRKKHRKGTYSVVYETPLAGNNPSCSNRQNKGDRSNNCNPVSKALFQDDR